MIDQQRITETAQAIKTSFPNCTLVDATVFASWHLERIAELERSQRPKIVCICGSSRFVGESAVKAWELNKQGIATFFMPLLPMWYSGVREHHQAEAEGVAENLDNLWLKLIEMADEVFIVNVNGYIGDRTKIELAYARRLGKPVAFLETGKIFL